MEKGAQRQFLGLCRHVQTVLYSLGDLLKTVSMTVCLIKCQCFVCKHGHTHACIGIRECICVWEGGVVMYPVCMH